MKALRPALALALLATLAPARADELDASGSRAEAVATLLAAADGSAASPSRQRRRTLGRTLAALDQLGAHAQLVEDDPVPAWRMAAGTRDLPPMRGRVLGPAFRHGWMAPGSEFSVQQLFMGGQSAAIAVAASPNEPVQLSVTGPDAAQTCPASRRACRWMPIFTERYTVVVRNVGTRPARVYLVFD